MDTDAVERDYSAPPRTEFEGREYTAEVTFCLAEDATDEQVEEYLQFEWGGGSIGKGNPLNEAGAFPNRLSLYRLRRTGRLYYTDWEATAKDGSCKGRGRVEYDRGEAE